MNDFTKNDLIEISKIFKAYLDGYEAKLPIFIKLQCMIENYCEHQDSEANHDYEVEKCKNCGELFI